MQATATFLAWAYIVYGLGLFLLTAYGVHLVAVGVLVYVVIRRRRAPFFRLGCEVFYGLLNPILYLVVLRVGLMSAEAEFWQRIPLQTIAWILFATIWLSRLTGAAVMTREYFVPVWRSILVAALVCLSLFSLKDILLWGAANPHWGSGQGGVESVAFANAWFLSAVLPLYLIPMVLLVDYLWGDSWQKPESDFLLLPETSARATGLVVAAVATVTLGAVMWRPSDAAVRQRVISLRSEIVDAASEYGVDPAVIGSIVYVTNRYQITPFRNRIERLVMTAWLADPKSNYNIAAALNISVGLTQIKPVTAQTASQLVAFAGRSSPNLWLKEYRDVPELNWMLPSDLPLHVPIPWGRGAGKADVVASLLDTQGNLRACAMILAIYQAQWEGGAPASRIATRPEILGTLFQIGFERSHPKPDPRGNAFGRQVQAEYDTEWMRAAFR